MKIVNWALFGFAFCLVVFILTLVVMVIVLKRGSQTISQKLTERGSNQDQAFKTVSENTRWARAGLKGQTESPIEDIALSSCPACGGLNPQDAAVCSYCGRNL